MTDRDHFAAAALTGLLVHANDGIDEETLDTPSDIAYTAYAMADAMLREREKTSVGVTGMDPVTDRKSAATPGACASPCSQPFDSAPITLDAYRQFVGEVMNWISEATGFLHDDVLRTDDARDIITDACSRCWDAFDRIAPTGHGTSPEAIASVESVAPQPTTRGDSDRTDKAAPRPSEGTGDTPKPIKGDVSDRSKPITGPDPDSRVWETHTPATHATPGEGSVPREGTQEPVAWAVCTPSDGHWSPCYFHEPHAQRCANAIVGEKNVVALYRKPTLTDAEREDMECAASRLQSDPNGPRDLQVADTLRGLLERLGGGE